MTNLLRIRQAANITQEELAEKSGISVRTIQRIEAGTNPKGYSLRMLAKALNVSENELLQQEITIPPTEEPIVKIESIDSTKKEDDEDFHFLKGLNISILLLTFLPPLNILVPLGIIIYKKKWSPLTKLFISTQIFWLILSPILFFALMIIFSSFLSGLKHTIVPLLFILFPLINIYITCRNASHLTQEHKLYIPLKCNIL